MKNKKEIKVGIDPGLSGGITVLTVENNKIIDSKVYAMPTKKLIIGKGKNAKERKQLDIPQIISIFSPLKNQNVTFVLQKASVRMGEGAQGALTMGANWGILRGMASAYQFQQLIITPMTWKKTYPSIMQCKQAVELKQLQSKLKSQLKIQKEKKTQKLNSKEQNKIANKKRKEQLKLKDKQIKRVAAQIKKISKAEARAQASKLFPQLAQKFKKVGSDGLAESCLIALFAFNNITIVQEQEE